MLENACSVDIDVFRERLNGDIVQDVLKQNKKIFKGIYTVYAADDQLDDAVAQGDTINNKELCSFCKEMKLNCWVQFYQTEWYMVRQIFAFVQQEEEELDEDDDEDEECGDNEMVYSEFAEATVVLYCLCTQTKSILYIHVGCSGYYYNTTLIHFVSSCKDK